MSAPSKTSLRIGKGELAAIASSVFFAMAYVARRLHTSKISNPQIRAIMYASGTVGLLIISLGLGQGLIHAEQLTGHTIIWLIIGGGLNLANIMLINYVFSSLPSIVANILLMSEFVFALLLGYFLYVEVPRLVQLFGAVLITGSIVFQSYSEQRQKLS